MSNWIVVPVYNEASRFNMIYWNTIVKDCKFNFLFVNDGSEDNTQELIERISHPNTRNLKLSRNVGKAEAIRRGFLSLIFEKDKDLKILGYLDSDCAFNPLEVRDILHSTIYTLTNTQFDTVWLSRVKLASSNIDRNHFRHLIGRVIATFLGYGMQNYPYDTQCGFKVFRSSELLRKSLDSPFHTRWFLDIEIYSRISALAGAWMQVLEIPLKTWQDVGNSRIRIRNSISILNEIFFVKFLLNTTKKGVFRGSQRN